MNTWLQRRYPNDDQVLNLSKFECFNLYLNLKLHVLNLHILNLSKQTVVAKQELVVNNIKLYVETQIQSLWWTQRDAKRIFFQGRETAAVSGSTVNSCLLAS